MYIFNVGGNESAGAELDVRAGVGATYVSKDEGETHGAPGDTINNPLTSVFAPSPSGPTRPIGTGAAGPFACAGRPACEVGKDVGSGGARVMEACGHHVYPLSSSQHVLQQDSDSRARRSSVDSDAAGASSMDSNILACVDADGGEADGRGCDCEQEGVVGAYNTEVVWMGAGEDGDGDVRANSVAARGWIEEDYERSGRAQTYRTAEGLGIAPRERDCQPFRLCVALGRRRVSGSGNWNRSREGCFRLRRTMVFGRRRELEREPAGDEYRLRLGLSAKRLARADVIVSTGGRRLVRGADALSRPGVGARSASACLQRSTRGTRDVDAINPRRWKTARIDVNGQRTMGAHRAREGGARSHTGSPAHRLNRRLTLLPTRGSAAARYSHLPRPRGAVKGSRQGRQAVGRRSIPGAAAGTCNNTTEARGREKRKRSESRLRDRPDSPGMGFSAITIG
ncbi:hypothetical protein FB451DRAFT_1190377 [Mycena latifolia]|nr:hypothetical protein FB451DRAFT_1190377 [Mycena latifolia]